MLSPSIQSPANMACSTAPVAIVTAPVFAIVTSPETATSVALFDPLPTRILALSKFSNLVNSIAADEDGFFDGYVPTNLEINLSEGSLAGRLKKFDAEGCYLQIKIMHNDVATDTDDSFKIMVMYVVD